MHAGDVRWKEPVMSVSPTVAKTGNAGRASVRIDEAGLTAKVAEVLDRWPSAGLAAGVVRGGSLEGAVALAIRHGLHHRAYRPAHATAIHACGIPHELEGLGEMR
jgi:hypothetical protein